MKCNEPRTTCPSREEFAKELFNSLGGCVIKETTGHTIYDRWVCAKFGKDNSGMDLEAMRFQIHKRIRDNVNSPAEAAMAIRSVFDYLNSISQQPPKETTNKKWPSQCDDPKCHCKYESEYFNEPKERKVSLEEIANELDKNYGETPDGYNRLVAQAILSLLNATEERKGEE